MGRTHKIAMGVMALGLAGSLGACALPGNLGMASSRSAKQDPNTGLATRALMALQANKTAEAIALAEQAVAWKPDQPSFRQLLASAYLADGRYASAETAFRDALSLDQGNSEVALKLALVAIARGRSDEGLETLAAYDGMLDSADVGLALALAGRTRDAVLLLDQAARQRGADARVRQNLALAYALNNQWDKARVVAMQDLPANLVDQRMQQWAEIAKPGRPGAKMAQFMGITPKQDPGMPAKLALTMPMKDSVAFAEAEIPVAPVAIEPARPVVDFAANVDPLPEPVAAAKPVAKPAQTPAPVVKPVAKDEPVRLAKAPSLPGDRLAPTLAAARPALSPKATKVAPEAKVVPAVADAKVAKDLLRPASTLSSGMNAVVQLGSYSARGQVDVAWDRAVARHGALKGKAPVTARFAKGGKTFYRLGVGVASRGEGQSLCGKVKASGGSCFVREVSGDAPVVLASNN